MLPVEPVRAHPLPGEPRSAPAEPEGRGLLQADETGEPQSPDLCSSSPRPLYIILVRELVGERALMDRGQTRIGGAESGEPRRNRCESERLWTGARGVLCDLQGPQLDTTAATAT